MSCPCGGNTKGGDGCRCDPPFVVPLPYDRPPLTLNKRLHHMAEYRIREQIRTDVLALARFYKLPQGLDRVHVVLHWAPIVRRTRDTDNPAPTVKAILDALRAGTPKKPGHGLIPDDDSEHVSSEVVIHPVRPFRGGWDDEPRMWLEIHEGSAA